MSVLSKLCKFEHTAFLPFPSPVWHPVKPRSCIGQRFAKLEVIVMAAKVILELHHHHHHHHNQRYLLDLVNMGLAVFLFIISCFWPRWCSVSSLSILGSQLV